MSKPTKLIEAGRLSVKLTEVYGANSQHVLTDWEKTAQSVGTQVSARFCWVNVVDGFPIFSFQWVSDHNNVYCVWPHLEFKVAIRRIKTHEGVTNELTSHTSEQEERLQKLRTGLMLLL
jgi:hypothetical protein